MAGPSKEVLAAGAAVLSANSDDPDVLRNAAASALGRPLTDDDVQSVGALLGSIRPHLESTASPSPVSFLEGNKPQDIMPGQPDIMPEPPPDIMPGEEPPPDIMPGEEPPDIMPAEEPKDIMPKTGA